MRINVKGERPVRLHAKDLEDIQDFTYLRCKTNTIPILMHQMHISNTQVSSVVLGPKRLEIPPKKSENCIRAEKKILCHEIERNSSKDRAMDEGDMIKS
jgi:hypothetical protein